MRGNPFLLAALVALRPWSPAMTRAAEPVRVGLTDVTADGSGQGALSALRDRLSARVELMLPRDAARSALESPLNGSADADAARAAARRNLADAQEAYSRFDYDGALERLRQAELAAMAAPGALPATDLLEAINLLAGVVELDRGREPEALQRFRLAHRLVPERTALDPGQYRPRAVALYARAAGPSTGGDGRLAVTTEPSGAEVFVDGRAAGAAPAEITVPAGAHYVTAQLPGSATRCDKSTVAAGQTTRLTLLLARLTPEEQARQTRRALAAGGAAWADGPATLARLAALDLLVLIRAGHTGALEAAIYDARDGALGRWMPAVPVDGVLAALALRLAPPAPPAATASGAAETSPPARPWYRRWWVAPSVLLAAGAAALGGWMLERGQSTTYTLNRWCFGQTCSP